MFGNNITPIIIPFLLHFSINQQIFILQHWLIQFWITNFVVVEMRSEPGL